MPGNPEGRAVQIAIGDRSAVRVSLRLVDDLDAIEQELDVARARDDRIARALDPTGSHPDHIDAGRRSLRATCGAASDRLPVQIARPSIIVGEQASGWTTAFNVLYGPIRALSTGAYRALPLD